MRVIESLNRAMARVIMRVIDIFYVKGVARFVPRHTFRYLACGVGNYLLLDTLLYYLIYHHIVSGRYCDLWIVTISPHIMAMVLVFPITFFIGFWLNRYVAFESTTQRARVQVAKYALSIGGSIIISYLALKFLVEVCGIWATPAKGFSSVITAIYSYMAARYFTFKKG